MTVKHILVTGANGFVGRQLCLHLKNQGFKVRALLRNANDGPWDEVVQCELEQLSISKSVFEDVDTVFHLAGIAHAMKMPKSEEKIYWRVNVDATQALLDGAVQAGVSRFIYFSSTKAMGEPGNECIDENWPALPQDIYGQSKREAEARVLKVGQQSGMHVVCLRPTLVYGPNVKGNLHRMLSAIDKGRFPPLPDTGNRRSMVGVNDLVEAALMVAKNSKANGQSFIVSDGQDYSTRQLYEAMYKTMAKSVPSFSIPVGLFKLGAKLGDLAGKVIGRAAPLNSEVIQRIFGSACYSSDKLRNVTGWQAKQTFNDILPDMVASYKNKS